MILYFLPFPNDGDDGIAMQAGVFQLQTAFLVTHRVFSVRVRVWAHPMRPLADIRGC